MKIEHRPGRLHSNADGLSRKPYKQCGRIEAEVSSKSINEACSAGLNLSEAQATNGALSHLKHWV
ncbi:hypothetical protein DPMN_094808 [Dreissena polymorpha]|uniref:Uncharacterized protein n=1 Tax=Dreissena polymorpha TaxID=45954 RepID=A0A9D4L6T0_DREPO|nr:hypothetical protein DPMN_094808 [Dreissena polymorpha]